MIAKRFEGNVTWIKSVICDSLNKTSKLNLSIEEIVKNDIGYTFGFDNINWEQFDWTYELGLPLTFYTTKDISIYYNNLYTFVLICGRKYVPYYEWIYENEYYTDHFKFYKDPVDHEYKVVDIHEGFATDTQQYKNMGVIPPGLYTGGFADSTQTVLDAAFIASLTADPSTRVDGAVLIKDELKDQ